MTQIILPNSNITGANLWSQVEGNDQAITNVVNGDIGRDNIQTGLLPPTGSMLQFGGGSAPTGWLLCDGSAVSRTGAYADLFGVIGTAYGAGDGATTFNLPDLRGRMPVGKGTHTSVDTLGENDGTAVANRRPAHSHTGTGTTSSDGWHQHTGSTSTNGSHTHAIGYITFNGSLGDGSGIYDRFRQNASFTTSNGVQAAGSHNHTVTTDGAGSHSHTVSATVGSTGGTTDAPSFVVVNFIIKT